MTKTAAPTAIARNSIWTVEDLQNLPLSRSPKTHIYLQAIARQLKIPTRRVPKSDLIEKIMETCSSYRRTTHTTTPTTDREILIHKIASSFYQNEGEKLGFYNYLKKCIISGVTVSNSSPEFNRLLVIFRPVLESHLRGKGDYTITTLINYKNDIFKLLKIWLEDDFSGYDWMSFFSVYKDAVNAAFEDVATIQKKQTKSSTIARQQVQLKVQCCPAILKAREILSNVKNYQKRKWREVVWALMLATGRRQSEILCTAEFQATGDDYQVLFSGQLLKHGDDIAPYPIPLLVPTKLVIAGMRWLDCQGKRDSLSPVEVNSKYSKALSSKTKQLISDNFKLKAGDWTYTDNGDEKDLKTSLFLRHVYSLVCSQIYKGTQSTEEYLKAILGHNKVRANNYNASKTYSERVLISESTKALHQAIFN
ncbi:MAG: protelomerase family protein [Trichodesmium sp. St11_bin5]|nr:protelomerase family protein [Trichodesmium sp. St11_bin5]